MTLHSRLEKKIVNFLVGCRALRGSTAIVGNLRQENLEDLLYVKEIDLGNKICYRPSAASSVKLVLLEFRGAIHLSLALPESHSDCHRKQAEERKPVHALS